MNKAIIFTTLSAIALLAIGFNTYNQSELKNPNNQNLLSMNLSQQGTPISQTTQVRSTDPHKVEALEAQNLSGVTALKCMYINGKPCLSYTFNNVSYRLNDVLPDLQRYRLDTFNQICIWEAQNPSVYATNWYKSPIGYQSTYYAYFGGNGWKVDGSVQNDYCLAQISCSNGVDYYCS